MKVAPLTINDFSFRSKIKPQDQTEKGEKKQFRIEFEIPDDVIICYEKWPDGFFYPQTAGQYRIQQNIPINQMMLSSLALR